MRTRKFVCVLLIILIATTFALPASAVYSPPFELKSQAVYMENLTNDLPIYDKNADSKMYPASLTKIMTVALALENIQDPDNVKIPLKQYIQDALYGTNASLGGILLGEEVTASGLMYACMLQSANEAALMLADYMGDGSQARFVEMMNAKAAELGCTGTNFANPNGLFDENNYTTARDMAKIVKYAMSLPKFMEICTQTSKDIGPTNKHDRLVEISTIDIMKSTSSYYYSPVQGIKTGTLPESGRCLASSATLEGQTYIIILLGAPINDEQGKEIPEKLNFTETKSLYQWAFGSFGEKVLLEEGKHVIDLPVALSFEKDSTRLLTASPFATLVPSDVEPTSIQLVADIPKSVDAPVKKGDKLGTAKLLLANEVIGTVDLISADSIEQSKVLYTLQVVRNIFKSFLFKFLFCFVVMLVILYITLMVMRNRNRSRAKRRRRSPHIRNM